MSVRAVQRRHRHFPEGSIRPHRYFSTVDTHGLQSCKLLSVIYTDHSEFPSYQQTLVLTKWQKHQNKSVGWWDFHTLPRSLPLTQALYNTEQRATLTQRASSKQTRSSKRQTSDQMVNWCHKLNYILTWTKSALIELYFSFSPPSQKKEKKCYKIIKSPMFAKNFKNLNSQHLNATLKSI